MNRLTRDPSPLRTLRRELPGAGRTIARTQISNDLADSKCLSPPQISAALPIVLVLPIPCHREFAYGFLQYRIKCRYYSDSKPANQFQGANQFPSNTVCQPKPID